MKTLILPSLFATILTLSFSLFAKEKILVSLSVKEPLGMNSQILKEGVKLAYESQPKEIQEAYDIIFEDNDGSLNETTSKLQHEIKKGGVIAIIGGMNTDQALYINIMSKKHKIPFITPYATNPKVTEENPYAFRMCFDDVYQIDTLARYIHEEFKLSKGVILVNDKQSYPIGIKDLFQKKFKQMAGTKIEVIPFSKTSNIDDKLIEKIKKAAPEFILLPSYEAEAAEVISLLLENKVDAQFFGTDSWGGQELLTGELKKIGKPFVGHYVQHWSPEYKSEANKKFLELKDSRPELKKYNTAALLAPLAMGYESVNFLFQAIKEKQDRNLVDTLKLISMTGVTGTVTMGEKRTPKKGLFMYEVTNAGEKFEKYFQ
ncbi:MAG: ABC transporter substrate-binding protein [Bacteriovoracaceae bacterium]